MLRALDILLTLVHLLIISLNLFAWIPAKTRKLHLWVVGITLFCWTFLGIWFGVGYCPITDWQWAVKVQLGENDLPASFVEYYVDWIFDAHFDPTLIDWLTIGCFAIAIIASLYVNLVKKKGTN